MSRGAGGAPLESVGTEVPAGIGPGPPSPPAAGGREKGPASPPPDHVGPSSTEPPRSARRSGALRFGGLGPSGPNAEERRVASVLGGAAHGRVAGGPKSGRAWEAGRARPSQEDSVAAPARRSSGTSTWRPGATRGGALGQRGPAAGSVCPWWPAWQQRLMPQPRLLHLAPHAPGRACHRPPTVGGCAAGLRAGRFWAAPMGASWPRGAGTAVPGVRRKCMKNTNRGSKTWFT